MKLWLSCVVMLVLTVVCSARADNPAADGPPAATQTLMSWFNKNIPTAYRSSVPLIIHEMSESDLLNYIDTADGSHPRKKSSVKDQDDIDGVYDSKPPRIAVVIGDNGQVDTFTFAHEYGHYIWFDVMNKDDRKAYERIYKKSKSEGHLVTDYAYDNVEEGFAEAFSFYTNLPADLEKRDPDSYAFLEEWNQTR